MPPIKPFISILTVGLIPRIRRRRGDGHLTGSTDTDIGELLDNLTVGGF